MAGARQGSRVAGRQGAVAAGRQGRGGELSHKGQRYVASAWVRRREMEMEGRGSRPSLGVFMCNGERSPRLTSPPPFLPSARLSSKGAQDPAFHRESWSLKYGTCTTIRPLAPSPKPTTKEPLQYLLYVSVGFIWPEVERNFEGF